jgi:hypothetical protein
MLSIRHICDYTLHDSNCHNRSLTDMCYNSTRCSSLNLNQIKSINIFLKYFFFEVLPKSADFPHTYFFRIVPQIISVRIQILWWRRPQSSTSDSFAEDGMQCINKMFPRMYYCSVLDKTSVIFSFISQFIEETRKNQSYIIFWFIVSWKTQAQLLSTH